MYKVLVTFFYPSMEAYIGEFINSVNNQSLLPDELLIFNDNILSVEKKIKNLKIKFTIIPIDGSPFDIRIKAIKFLANYSCDFIFFQDADDLMDRKRIELVASYLKKYDLVVNDISLMDENGNIFKNSIWKDRLQNQYRFNHEFIREKNIVGLGNTSIQKRILSKFVISKPAGDIYAADWYIFYQLLSDKNILGIFTSDTSTFYRQHRNNTSTLNKFDSDSLSKTIKVKKAHYEALNESGYNMKDNLLQLEKLDVKSRLAILTSHDDLYWWEI